MRGKKRWTRIWEENNGQEEHWKEEWQRGTGRKHRHMQNHVKNEKEEGDQRVMTEEAGGKEIGVKQMKPSCGKNQKKWANMGMNVRREEGRVVQQEKMRCGSYEKGIMKENRIPMDN